MSRIFSGIQPSAVAPHIGNYLGALRQWVELQNKDAVYCVVDLHALTVPQNPASLRDSIDTTYALLLALGIDPKIAMVTVQSHVREHAELGWILQTISTMGELSRMTQFKDKSAKHEKSIPTGLFTYPTLMAADILVYDTEVVPIGEDQVQHVEITRDLAERFNSRFGETFTLPKAHIIKETARIMSLSEPTKKMSKSDENKHATVFLTDSADEIRSKFARAVTDSQTSIVFDPTRAGLYNLLTIYSAVTEKQIEEIEAEFVGKGYKELKEAVSGAVIAMITPIQEKMKLYLADREALHAIMIDGALRAREKANKKLEEVYKKIGIR